MTFLVYTHTCSYSPLALLPHCAAVTQFMDRSSKWGLHWDGLSPPQLTPLFNGLAVDTYGHHFSSYTCCYYSPLLTGFQGRDATVWCLQDKHTWKTKNNIGPVLFLCQIIFTFQMKFPVFHSQAVLFSWRSAALDSVSLVKLMCNILLFWSHSPLG